jgi:glutamate-1-semialdehyde aminotransferase
LNSLAARGAALPGQTARTLPGVPRVLSALHHNCKWNDLAAVERLLTEYDEEIAAVVVTADYAGMGQGIFGLRMDR